MTAHPLKVSSFWTAFPDTLKGIPVQSRVDSSRSNGGYTEKPTFPGRRTAIEESELIRRILSGEKELYASFVNHHGTYLFQLCLAFLGDPHEAEEAAQEIFIKAYRSLASFQGRSQFRTWITRIGINHCKDLLRQKSRGRFLSLEAITEKGRSLPESPAGDPAGEGRQLPQLTDAMLETLTEGERNLIRLLEEGTGLSYEQMAGRLGLTLDGVKGRLKRARQKLRRFLKPGMKEEENP